jgi:N-acetylmuramoyl-L-alanine amidase
MSDNKEIDNLARTIWGEARGEGSAGMEAVACTVQNRVKQALQHVARTGKPHVLFGDGTFTSCCRRRAQFSCWNQNDPNFPKLLAVTDQDAQFRQCLGWAEKAVNGELADTVFGATYYYDGRTKAPDWAAGKQPCARIGHHLFFNSVD